MPTTPLPRIATYRLVHRWSSGTDADTSAYDEVHYMTPPGVTIDGLGRSQARSFGPPAVPALDDTLPNYDGIYSPGGILGLFVGRGPETTFDADWGVEIYGDADDVLGDADVPGDGTLTKRLFSGQITTAPQDISSTSAQVQIRSLGTINQLARKRPVMALLENVSTDVAIEAWLDACDWPSDKRILDAGDTIMSYVWGNGQTDGVSGLNQIVGAEGVPACWYVDADGYLHFEGRQYRATARRSTEVQWVFVDGARGGSLIDVLGDDPLTLGDDPYLFGDGPINNRLYHVKPTAWGSNPDEVVAEVSAPVNVRTATSTQKIWEYGGPLVLAAAQVIDIPVTTSAPFKTAVAPAAATDYSVSVGALSAVALIGTSGQQITLRLTAGGAGATVIGVTSNGIQVRAISLPVTSALTVKSTVDVGLSSARYEPKPYTIPSWPEITYNRALDNCNNFARRYQRPRDQMTITLANVDARHLYAILTLAISDRVRVVHTHGGIDAAFFVETIRHDLSSGGGLHIVTLGLERVTDDIPARFGSARFGFDSFSE